MSIWTDDHSALLDTDLSHDEIADRTGRTVNAVRDRRLHLIRARRPRVQRVVAELWGQPVSVDMIAREAGTDPLVVSMAAREMGLPSRKTGSEIGADRAAAVKEAAPSRPRGYDKADLKWAEAEENDGHPEAVLMRAHHADFLRWQAKHKQRRAA